MEQTDLWCKPCKPEEALDAGGDPVPVYHVPPLTPAPGGPPPPGLHPLGQDTLVNISEPLLDLRSYACGGGGVGAGPPPDIAADTGTAQHSPKYICL